MDENNLVQSTESSGITTIADIDAIMYQEAWMGDYTLNSISESIEEQFNTYSTLTDTFDYVSQFYNQLETSREISILDPTIIENDYLPILNGIENDFISMMIDLIGTKLNLSIISYEKDNIDYNKIKSYIITIYQYFILNSNNNFINSITKDYLERYLDLDLDDDKLFSKIYNDLEDYSPLLINIDCTKFLLMTLNESDLLFQYWDNMEITGNFLEKYTPRLYRNEDLRSSITTNIINIYMLQKGIELNGGK